MIPIKDENPTYTTPFVTYAIIAINVVVFFLTLGSKSAAMSLSMVPKEVVTGTDIPPFHSIQPIWLTILTSMFMHGGFLHIGGNMLYLWVFGNNIEDALGHAKFLFFYLLCGVVAAVSHIMSNPGSTVPTVGASGAIAGVLGAYLILYPNARIITLIFLGFFVTTVGIPAIVMLGYWFIIQLISSQLGSGPVAYWAHIGGFISGVILIFLFGGRGLARRRRRTYSAYEY